MRFMMLVIPKGYEKSEPDTMPDAKLVAEMTKYNASLKKAGVLLDLNGLHPPAGGTGVVFSKGETQVVEGPFRDTRETLGGYWMIQVGSKEEAVEWARKAPMAEGDILEIRQVQEMEEFSPEVKVAANF